MKNSYEILDFLYNSTPIVANTDIPDANSFKDKKEYVVALWKYYNKKYFNNKLKEPKFIFNIPGNIIFGQWKPKLAKLTITKGFSISRPTDEGTLKINLKLNKKDDTLKDTLLHEMCHEAVSQIDKKIEYDDHGEYWKKWAHKCGIPENPVVDADAYDDSVKERRKQLSYDDLKIGDIVEAYIYNSPTTIILSFAVEIFERDHNVYCLYVDQKTYKLMITKVDLQKPIYKSTEAEYVKQLKKAINIYGKETIENFFTFYREYSGFADSHNDFVQEVPRHYTKKDFEKDIEDYDA